MRQDPLASTFSMLYFDQLDKLPQPILERGSHVVLLAPACPDHTENFLHLLCDLLSLSIEAHSQFLVNNRYSGFVEPLLPCTFGELLWQRVDSQFLSK